MAANKIVLLGPVAITTTIANIFSPPTVTGGTGVPPESTNTFYILRKLRVVNTTAAAILLGMWKQITIGATPVAGKELIAGATATLLALDSGKGLTVPANGVVESFDPIRITSSETDKFIVAGASANGLTLEWSAEMGIV